MDYPFVDDLCSCQYTASPHQAFHINSEINLAESSPVVMGFISRQRIKAASGEFQNSMAIEVIWSSNSSQIESGSS